MRAVRLFLLMLPLLAAALSTAAELETLAQVQDCIRGNRPNLSIVQTYVLESVDRIGSKRTSEGKIYWKKFDNGLSKTLVRVTGPADVRGTAALIIERKEGAPDIFSYLPELDKVRRVTERSVTGSFMGSDFSYEDLERIQGMSEDGERKLMPSTDLDGQPAYVIEGVPGRAEDSEYSRVLTYVDQQTCVAVKVEGFDKKDKLIKTFSAPRAEIRKIAGRSIPHAVHALDEANGTRTDLQIDEVEIDVDLPEKYFTEAALQRRR